MHLAIHGADNIKAYADATNRTPPIAFYERERGIVMIGGRSHHPRDVYYTREALLSVASLRHRGCALPVELWHDGDPELIAARHKLEAHGMLVRDFRDLPGGLDIRGYQLCSRAVLHSSFREVIFSDADVFALRDPTFLFESPMYMSTGWLMWRDWGEAGALPASWAQALRLQPPTDVFTTDSGLMLVDRARHWRALQLVDHMNAADSALLRDHSFGDNDLWQMAALFHEEAYSKVTHRVPVVGYISRVDNATFCGYSSLFVDPEHPNDIGRAPMLHRRDIKLTMDNGTAGYDRFLKGTLDEPPEAEMLHRATRDTCECFSHYLDGCWDYPSLGIDGSPEAAQLVEKIARLEEGLLDLSSRLAATPGSGSAHFRPDWYDAWARGVQPRTT